MAARSISAERITEFLDARGVVPRIIVVDNGPEFTSQHFDQWAHERGIQLQFIRPGKPVENACIESFNGKFRDECLNESWFVSLTDAQRTIEAWRIEYNESRPHSALAGRTPTEFATAHLLTAPSPSPSNPNDRYE